MGDAFIEMKGIVKKFRGTVALKGVDFEVKPGEIHALLGENGAGKSTLIKILTGAYAPDEGEILVADKSFSSIPVKELADLGISVVYQDLKLAPGVSIMENILMGNLPKKAGMFIDRKAALQLAKEAISKAGVEMDPDTIVGDLKAADQEIVAIAKALSKNAKLLILDEPTALLAEDDVQRLFEILRALAKKGVSILYISHRLEEVFTICDRVTVLRDGSKVWTKSIADVSKNLLIEAIAGSMHAEGDLYYKAPIKDTLLKVEGLSRKPYYQQISFELRGGEVVGLFGLVGGGKSEMLKGIFGDMKPDSGTIYLGGERYATPSPQASINKGIGFVPEDRKSEGFLPRMPIYINANLPAYRRIYARSGWVAPKAEKRRAQALVEGFNVKFSSLEQDIDGLSGGNQQKIVVAKWIGTKIKVLLLDEPTAGIDVGARRDIFRVSRKLADEGKTVMYCSSYLPEIMEVADRILVMSKGRITEEFHRNDGFHEDEIMKAAYQ
ncbi:sugar ABC transporter ATP-binding protein [Cohnella terricola]|uniref:Sugar ABC transporter ATP-binding protein n=1 Tax=Cohnella terricola TaxID=1289167 RepID=A0A559J8Q0_9BACL|nr:sugar ABC transporter ATP-binding protein [Cohnella terricola]TVX96253.1 sugar ABC transporter ATP-binding protein [Cohnella terricola]